MDRPGNFTDNDRRPIRIPILVNSVAALLLGLQSGCAWLHERQGRDTEICRQCIEESFAAQQSGDLNLARGHLNRATEIQPEHAETWWNLAELSIQQDNYPAAVSELKRYNELQPSDPQGYMRLAQLYYLQNQYEEAEEMLNEVLKRSPQQFDAIMLSARLARKQADHQQAISAYYHALQVSPHHAEATLELSELLISRYQPTQAASLLRQLSRQAISNDDLARTHMNLGIAYGQVDRWDNAVAELDYARSLQPNINDRDLYRLAYANWKSGAGQQALKLLIEMADIGVWNGRAEALYAIITETTPQHELSPPIMEASFQANSKQAEPFPNLVQAAPIFLPDRLIPVQNRDPQFIIPPEWAMNEETN